MSKEVASSISRRAVLASAVALMAVRRTEAATKMVLSLHQQTSADAGYRKSLEGWSRAGIRIVELTAVALDEFLKSDTLAAARRVMTDLGLTPVSAASGAVGVWEPGPARAMAVETFKRRCDMFAALGLTRIYAPSVASQAFTEDDYKVGVDNMREVGSIAKQFGLTAMIEATRASTFIAALPTMLRMTRAAGNVAPLLDCYHFWSGPNKLEDLDAIRPGEVGHVHFQDTPDVPRELLVAATRSIPGDGVAPLVTILQKLSDKGYVGALSVELFLPVYTTRDPFDLAREIRQKSEAVMRRAGVL